MPKPEDYADLTRDQLVERLRLAERLALFYAWQPIMDTRSDRGKAQYQVFLEWLEYVGVDYFELVKHPDLDNQAIFVLAREYDKFQASLGKAHAERIKAAKDAERKERKKG